ncbi:hypothetical protein HY218_01990, partial [Candidatus Saccharibacteria bacterium]|nr:hypothetical protein [Candidatus Saccharibacteria bacterium]
FDVITEILGTPADDFIRYSLIKTDQKNSQGKTPSFNSILGVWSKSPSLTQKTDGQLYSRSVLGVVPFANLAQPARQQLLDLMQSQKVYDPDYLAIKRSLHNGRPVYTYVVKVNAEAYIVMLKKYASVVGLTQFDQTNPADYRTAEPLRFQFDIDVWTHELKVVRYSTPREEHYGSFGIQTALPKAPTQTISTDELQQRVQAAQQL